MRIPTYAEREAARLTHRITHHDERGLMWSSCACGWKSRKLDCYHNMQVTQSIRDGEQHQTYHMNNDHEEV